jgi:hypothetical protein
MSSFQKYFIIICSLFVCIAKCDTNDINYKDLEFKDIAQERMENLYFLKIKETSNTKIILTGHNIIDYDNFNSINRVRTYTTIKVNF